MIHLAYMHHGLLASTLQQFSTSCYTFHHLIFIALRSTLMPTCSPASPPAVLQGLLPWWRMIGRMKMQRPNMILQRLKIGLLLWRLLKQTLLSRKLWEPNKKSNTSLNTSMSFLYHPQSLQHSQKQNLLFLVWNLLSLTALQVLVLLAREPVPVACHKKKQHFLLNNNQKIYC